MRIAAREEGGRFRQWRGQEKDAGRKPAVQGQGQKQIPRRPRGGLCRDDNKWTKQKQDARQDESGARARAKADPSSGEKPSVGMTAEEHRREKDAGWKPAVQGELRGRETTSRASHPLRNSQRMGHPATSAALHWSAKCCVYSVWEWLGWVVRGD